MAGGLTVSVVVAARDAAATLPDLLAGLVHQEHPPEEVVVVDDGSRDRTADLARASLVVTRVVQAKGRGPGAARNAGAARASGAVLAFTDADCVPSPGWLAAGLRAMNSADLVQGAVHAPPGVAVGPFDRAIRVERAHGLFETANLLIRRDLFERLGGFESWLNPPRGKELGEDVWLGYRALRSGARMAFSEDAVVHHAVFPRGPREYVEERLRLRYFPAMAARIPELRERFLFKGLFLTRRSAAFDLALAGAAFAAVRRRPVAALAALPYLRTALPEGPRVAAVQLIADAVGFVALVEGSVRYGSPVL